MGVGQPMIPATLLAGYQVTLKTVQRGFTWKILGLGSDPTLAVPAGAPDGQVLPAVHLLDRRRMGVQAHRPRWGQFQNNKQCTQISHPVWESYTSNCRFFFFKKNMCFLPEIRANTFIGDDWFPWLWYWWSGDQCVQRNYLFSTFWISDACLLSIILLLLHCKKLVFQASWTCACVALVAG